MQVGADQLVDRLVGVGDVAVELRLRDALGGEAERPRLGVARLRLELGEVDGAAVEPARRAGLEAGELEAAGGEAVAERLGRPSPARPPRVLASPMCMRALRNVPVVSTTAGPVEGVAAAPRRHGNAHRRRAGGRPRPRPRAFGRASRRRGRGSDWASRSVRTLPPRAVIFCSSRLRFPARQLRVEPEKARPAAGDPGVLAGPMRSPAATGVHPKARRAQETGKIRPGPRWRGPGVDVSARRRRGA